MEFDKDCPLTKMMDEYNKIYEEIKQKSLARLKHEGKDKDERITKIGDPYYNKPLEYALAIYSYYMCFKCKMPYFGGLKSCENMQQEMKGNENFKPEELVCAKCSSVGGGEQIENCLKHGTDYIEYKCRFCCSIAQ